MAEQKLTDSQRIANLELALAQASAGAPLGTLPEHGGGIGSEVEETWSLADQELAAKGLHPYQDDAESAPAPKQPTQH